MVCALFELRPIGEPQDETDRRAEQGADDARDEPVRPHDEADVGVGGTD